MTDRNSADSPVDIQASGWAKIFKRTWSEAGRDNIGMIAASVAFYAFLAFVPLLAAMVLIYGLVADPASVVRHVRAMTELMPAAAARLIGEQLMNMTRTAGGEKGWGLLLALLIALYGAMRGGASIITALNIAYGVEEQRGFAQSKIMALLITVGGLAALLAAIIAISLLGYAQALIPSAAPFLQSALRLLSWLGAAVAVSMLVAILYRYAPNRPETKWRWLTPGSIAATLLWLAATLGFAIYVANFGSYNATYGSLGAVVIFLTWLYLSAYVLLLGAELNAELEKQAGRGSAASRAS